MSVHVDVKLNLDAMDEDELRATAAALRKLASYAVQKAQAMHWRKKGRIREALIAETLCEQVYNTLPADCRW